MAHIQIRIDDTDKAAAQAVLKGMGLTLSGATKLFLKKVVAEQKIPFDITATTNVQVAPNMMQAVPADSGRFQNRVIA